VLTALGMMSPGKTIVHQGIQIGVRNGEDVAAAATVTPIGAAKLFVFFMPKRDAASTAISRSDINIGFVNEFHDFIPVTESGFKNEKPRAVRRVSMGSTQRIKPR
jgi:hypothetical protein